MKKLVPVLFLAVFAVSSITAQLMQNKPPKISPPPGQQQSQIINLSQPNLSGGLINNFYNFMNKAGIQTNYSKQVNSVAQLNSLSIGSTTKLNLPSLTNLSKNNFEKIIWNNETGTPRFIELKVSSGSSVPKTFSITHKVEIARNFLDENKLLLHVKDPLNEFQLLESKIDDLNFTKIKFMQNFKGVELWGKELIVHFNPSGNLVSINGVYEQTPESINDINGQITDQRAIQIAINEIDKEKGILPVPKMIAEILDYKNPLTKKVIWFDESKIPHLTWVVEVRSGISEDWFYFIDANSGNILNRYNAVCYDGITTGSGKDLNGVQRTFGTYQVGNNYFMIDASQPMFNTGQSQIPDNPVGAIVSLDLRNNDLSNNSSIYFVGSTNNQWNDPASVSAHYNGIVTYKYFLDVHKRNSVDDKGMTIYSIVHVTEQSKSMENAFWSGKLMCYGDGGTYFHPLAGGLDVAAHEMTHGITQFSANLEYQGQSGALNESMSDAFGSLVDTLNWKIGEQIIKDLQTFPSGAMRDMIDPHNGGNNGDASWQPSKMSEFVTTNSDNGGVHINSGIPNRAFYLVAKNISRLKASKIWYRALNNYLTRSSQFIDARLATIKAATDIYGSASNELTQVKNAWDAVEVLEGAATPPPPTSTLSGSNWILVTNTFSGDLNTIYMCKPTVTTAADIAPLSKTPVYNRPVVSDVSGVVLFIDKSNNLRILSANPTNPQEEVLDNSGVWSSVAIGPGIGSLALTTKLKDTTIYYFDLVKKTSKVFKIATKTFDAADKKTALYADALSFDPSGRYLLFDTYNEVKNASGAKISYWNINILDVQKGIMDVVFPPLAEGLSVGNPSYSKTAPTRFTFDYIDGKGQKSYVMAADFNTGDVGVVAGPLLDIGYPTYSGDDKTIVYHNVQSAAGGYYHTIEQMPLKSNFLEGTGATQNYLTDATYPYWFVIGTRTDVEKNRDVIPAVFKLSQNYPNPFNPETVISYQLSAFSHVTLKVYDVLGREVATLVNELQPVGFYNFQLSTNNYQLTSGIYFYKLTAGNFTATRKMLLLK